MPAICRDGDARRLYAHRRFVAKIVEAGKRPVSLGGDHSITYPIFRGIGKQIPALSPSSISTPIRSFNDDYEGNPTPTPAVRANHGRATRPPLIQIGSRTLKTAHQYEQRKNTA